MNWKLPLLDSSRAVAPSLKQAFAKTSNPARLTAPCLPLVLSRQRIKRMLASPGFGEFRDGFLKVGGMKEQLFEVAIQISAYAGRRTEHKWSCRWRVLGLVYIAAAPFGSRTCFAEVSPFATAR